MNKKIKFLISFLSLFLTFITLIRVLEYRYKYSSLYFKISSFRNIASKKTKCIAKSGSIVNYLNKEKLKTLIIVLDGFPSNEMVNSYYEKNSNFHNYMIKDNFYHYGKSIINSSSFSLAYLLSKLEPESNCTYPFNIGSENTNFLLASISFSDQNSICRKYLPFKLNPSIRSLKRFIRKNYMLKIKKDYSYQNYESNFDEWCYLNKKKFINLALDKIRKESKNRKNETYIIHEMQAKRFNKEKFNTLDKDYLKNVEILRRELLENEHIDLIIVMSDHGLRKTNIKNILDKKNNKLDKFTDDDHYSYFIYLISKNKNSKIVSDLKNLITDQKDFKKRYYLNDYNYPKEIKLDNKFEF